MCFGTYAHHPRRPDGLKLGAHNRSCVTYPRISWVSDAKTGGSRPGSRTSARRSVRERWKKRTELDDSGDGRALRFAIIGAGMAGILSAIKLTEAGPHRLHDLREGRGLRRHVAREHLPRPRLRRALAPLLVLLRAEPGLEPPVLARAGDPRLLRAGRARARPRGARALRRRGHALRARRRPLADRDRGRSPRRGRRRDRARPACCTTRATPTSTGIDAFAGAMFHSSRWDHDVDLDGRARRDHRHRLDRGADRRRRSSTGSRTCRCSSGPRSGSCRRPTRRSPTTRRPRSATTRRSCTELHASLSQAFGVFANAVVDAESPEAQWIEAACLHQPRGERLRPRAARAAAARVPRRVQAAHHLAELLRGDAGAERRARHRGDRVRRARRRPHEGRSAARARRARARHRLLRRRVHAADGGGRPRRHDARPRRGPNGRTPTCRSRSPASRTSSCSTARTARSATSRSSRSPSCSSATSWGSSSGCASGECREISATQSAMEEFEAARVEASKNTIWVTGCQSWYLDDRGVPAVWPWTFDRFRAEMRAPDPEAFEYR